MEICNKIKLTLLRDLIADADTPPILLLTDDMELRQETEEADFGLRYYIRESIRVERTPAVEALATRCGFTRQCVLDAETAEGNVLHIGTRRHPANIFFTSQPDGLYLHLYSLRSKPILR